jgi:hypothetical protein
MDYGCIDTGRRRDGAATQQGRRLQQQVHARFGTWREGVTGECVVGLRE